MRVLRLIPILMVLALPAAACGANVSRDADETSRVTTSPSPTTSQSEPTVATRDRIPVIVDYSPTSSDVAALLYVTQHPSVELLAVTLAGTGESHCEQGVANTLDVLAEVDLPDVPVACGQSEPVGAGNEWPDEWRDNADRLDGLVLAGVEDEGVGDEGVGDAVELLASTAAKAGGVTIIALGPLTNLAVALERHDDFREHVTDIVTMGGAVDVAGNAPNGVAEWNYFVDPTAVDVVVTSGIPVTMVPLDATNRVPVTRTWFAALAEHHITPASEAVYDLFAATRPFDLGFFFWDELAAAIAFDPSIARFEDRPIVVATTGAEQGRTMQDETGTNVRIAVDADRLRFESELLTTLNGGDPLPEIAHASAEEIEYFELVEAAVAALNAGLEGLFETPLAREVEAIANRMQADGGADAELSPDDEAALREFFTIFSTAVSEQAAALRDAVGELDPPDFAIAEHDAFVDAVGSVVATTDERLVDIRTRPAAELLTMQWEPDDEIEAVNSTCQNLATAASGRGIEVALCPQ